ncbi:MAG: DNA-3-methyladenine glycosylase II [uncultured Rubrobacteraceae bacterium]|uniref:Putative 3-methyladenine DNA glycosylase n=1 Tax=uncultured Rubrobacteraceae bacterium TaxID=349277 RepID=A0A6J4PF43_9ACTN|nr:MAG: DNA-3-methyladenine glycosylase II [uncultured Rubrobacteraceae bacterium]
MITSEVLGREFYDRDPRIVAVDLLGCVLVHETPEGIASGVIVETEAYLCTDDPACHAYRWPEMRNRTIFKGPGLAYVYLIYGRYPLINVNCEEEGKGSAVLIRALNPLEGLALMAERRGKLDLCTGPGKLTQALDIQLHHDAHDLLREPLTIRWGDSPEGEIVSTTRIGISRGTELPYRYLITNDPNVSVPPKTIVERGLERADRVP